MRGRDAGRDGEEARCLAPAAAALALLALVTPPAPAAAQGWVAPCDPMSADGTALGDAVRAWERSVEAAAPADDPAPLRAGYRAIFELPCAEIASELARPRMSSVRSMQRWLRDGGGAWLGALTSERPELRVPPAPLEELTLAQLDADDPLRALLCDPNDAVCGTETAGWRLRAETALEDLHTRDLRDHPRHGGSPEVRRARCLEEARALAPRDRYRRWSQCAATSGPERPALPIGRLRAPTRGWLVIRGRRGHHQFCEEVRAYHLETGAAYAAQRCHALVAPAPGTPPAPEITTTVGRVPVEALREAAWMTMVAPHVEDRRVADAVPIPPPLQRRFWVEPGRLGLFGRGRRGWRSSAQTRLAWAWVDGARTLASGTLTWPTSANAGESHAASLFRIAEAALAPGCAPEALPRGLPLAAGRSSVSPVDATPSSRRALQDRLEARLRELDRGACPRTDR